nr:MAG TPA: tail connector protein [Caudoviricetes sp.]
MMIDERNEELLIKVKNGLGITGDYQDDTLSIYIDEVKDFMFEAGVSNATINSNKSIGVITRGVSDLWDYGSGSTGLSPYFKERVVQLRAGEKDV